MSYEQTLQYLYDRLPVFHNIGSAAYKPGLDNTVRLMKALNNPHQRLKTIHVAGTNGKGSVSHWLAAIFQSAGYKTGLYTSPHLVDFGERIRVNGQMIEQQYVINFVEANKSLFDSIQPSFFEATMAMAFNYFADENVDIAIVEVGLGGRLDSTNIIAPLLSVITNISFDHVGFLGDTLAKIAFEKAGIIKPNTPVVVGEWIPETRIVFEQKALEMNSPLFTPDVELQFETYENGKMLCKTSEGAHYVSGLTGIYQLKNMATLLKAIDVFRAIPDSSLNIDEASLRKGIEQVVELTGLRGRWEMLQTSPCVVVDTGHNVGGITYVVEQLKQQSFDHLHIVIGMVNDKDINHVLDLLPRDAEYYFTQANVARALAANEMKAQAEKHGLVGNAYTSVQEAVDAAKKNASNTDFIFIGGSNFVVGEALKP